MFAYRHIKIPILIQQFNLLIFEGFIVVVPISTILSVVDVRFVY
jgi:hypothetical protein